MTNYEKRFYEDIHKLVKIQGDILKELKKMNEVPYEDTEITPEQLLDDLSKKIMPKINDKSLEIRG